MKKIRIVFFCFVAIGITIYSMQKTAIPLPKIVNNYVNDFLIIPIVSTIVLYVFQIIKNDKTYRLSLGVIWYISFLYALIFEWILPKFHLRYTADLIDVLLYFLGGLFFYLLQKND